MSTRMFATTASAVVASVLLVVPATSGAQDEGAGGEVPPTAEPAADPAPQAARLSVQVKGLQGGRRPALRKTIAVGHLRPFVPGQTVQVQFVRGGKVVKQRRLPVRDAGGGEGGTFGLSSPRLTEPGRYRVQAVKPASLEQDAARATSPRFRLRFPSLGQGDRGRAVKLLHRLLRKQGYHAPNGKRFTAATADAVLAFRKVNKMGWTRGAAPEVLVRLLRGKGAFTLRYPGARRHVEVDLSRQVMVLAKGGKPQHTFHVSTGKRSTPSDRGHFRFYRRQPGYNSVHMLHSVYYNRGEAIHGYGSVPTYPASNGCIRSPLPNARFIYDWVRLGMAIYVY